MIARVQLTRTASLYQGRANASSTPASELSAIKPTSTMPRNSTAQARTGRYQIEATTPSGASTRMR